MEKQTRMSKYKELRERLNEEVAIQHQEKIDVVEDDDFLAFMKKDEEKNLEDTLMEPKTFESLGQEEHVLDALNEVKVNVGKEAYNTRLDILSKIRKEEVKVVKEEKEEVKEPAKKMSLLERLAAMSPQEDVEELKEYQEEEKVKEEIKEEVVEERVDKVIVIDEEDEEEKESKLVTFLNYVIIVFMVVFVILMFFIAKELLF